MSDSWTVVLPFTKPLSLNDRQHHMAKARSVALWRDAAGFVLRAARVPQCLRVRVMLEYVPAQERRRDPDNLVASMKPVVDALVDVGIVVDDTQEFVEREWPRIAKADPRRKGGRFLLHVERLD